MVFKLNKQLRYPKEHIANKETNPVGVAPLGDPVKTTGKKSLETEGVKMINNLKTKNKINIRMMASMVLMLLCLFVMPNKINAATIDDTKALTTVWNIPSGDITITLPLSGTNMEMLVDWGDGTVETVTENYKTHPYNFAEDTPVTIKVQYVAGTELDWGYNASSSVTEGTTFYTYTQYLTKLTNWGDIPAKEYGFGYCVNLTEVSGETTESTFMNTKNMAYMFVGCTSLTTLNLSNWDTTNTTSMADMFHDCSALTSLDVGSLETAKVTGMNGMFYGCSGLTTLDVSGLDTSSATNMSYMFSACNGLTTLDLSNFNTNKVTNMQSMFNDCSGLTSLNVTGWKTGNVTYMMYMFHGCSSLVSLDLSSFNTAKVTDMNNMFRFCSNLEEIDLSSFDTNNVTTMFNMFEACKKLKVLNLSNFKTGKLNNTMSMFKDCNGLTEINIDNLNTSNVTQFGGMFCGCSSLTSLNLSNFNTSKAQGMGQMFDGCKSLISLDLRNFDTSNVTGMRNMFRECSSLTYLNLSSFNTSNVSDMYQMFNCCSSLTSLDLSSFDTSKITNMWCMFYGCGNLKMLDLSSFDTSNVTEMNGMFEKTVNLNTILISNNFKIASSGGNIFSQTNSNLSFITISKEPVSAQFKGVLTGSHYVYVPNYSLYSYIKTLSGDTLESNIKPIVEPIGDSPLYMLKGNAYIEKGATVAGYTADKASNYMVYGYSLETSGDVNTRYEGSYPVEYILTRNASGETQTTKATRMVNVYGAPVLSLSENGEGYNGEWTNEDIIGKTTILSPDTTSLVVKAGNSDWETNPSYAKVSYSGDEVYVVFNGNIDADVYVREVDVNGRATTYSSNACAIKIDKDVPTIENITHETKDKKLILRAQVNDEESGVARYAAVSEIDDEIIWYYYDETLSGIAQTLNKSGIYTLYVEDNAGNIASQEEILAIKDIKPVSGDIKIIATNTQNGEKYTDSQKIIINIMAEDNQSAKESIMIAIYTEEDYEKIKNKELEITWKNYKESIEYELPIEDGTYKIYALFKDEAGNESIAVKTSDEIITPVSIEVLNMPTKIEQEEGKAFDPEGMVLSVTYSDDSTAQITYDSVNDVYVIDYGVITRQLGKDEFVIENSTNLQLPSKNSSGNYNYKAGHISTDTGEIIYFGYNGETDNYDLCSNVDEGVTDSIPSSEWSILIENAESMGYTINYCLLSGNVYIGETLYATYAWNDEISAYDIEIAETGDVQVVPGYYCAYLEINGEEEGFIIESENSIDKVCGMGGVGGEPIYVFGYEKSTNTYDVYDAEMTKIQSVPKDEWPAMVKAYEEQGATFEYCGLSGHGSDGTMIGTFRYDETQKIYIVTTPEGEMSCPPYYLAYVTYFTDAEVVFDTVANEESNLPLAKYTNNGATVKCNIEINVVEGGPVAILDSTGTLTFASEYQIAYDAVSGEVESVYRGLNKRASALWLLKADLIKSVKFADKVSLNTTAHYFDNCVNLSYFDGTNLDTSSVTDMSYMFDRAGESASTFEIKGLENWDTSSVTDMSYMFYSAGHNASTFSLDLSNWDTSSAINMNGMFSHAGYNASTFSLDLSNWDTSSVTDMSYMFNWAGENASTFEIIGLENWDTSSVTDMSYMFNWAGNNAGTWSIGDLSNWDTSSVTDMSYMFDRAGYNANTWSIGDLGNWDTSSVINMNGMFSWTGHNAGTWSIGDLSNWDTSNVTNMNDMFSYAGYNASTWSIGDLSNWDTSSVTDMVWMFYSAGYNASTFSLDLNNWDTSSAINMNGMFSHAGHNASTFSLDLSNWDTSSAINMNGMFSGTGNNAGTWSIGDLSNWDTSSVTDMSSMFSWAGENASTFEIIGLENWDTSSVTDMSYMFYYAGRNASPFSLKLTGWDTRGVTTSTDMFVGCRKLKEISIGENFTLVSSSLNPYTFRSWYNIETGQAYLPSTIPQGVAATYVADYDESVLERYNITYDANGGTISGDTAVEVTKQATNGNVYASSMPEVVREGYKFLGWHTTEGKKVEKTAKVDLTSNITLYAHWEEKDTAEITYIANGGIFDTIATNVVKYSNPSGESVTILEGTYKEPTREKYVFAGWSTNKDSIKVKYTGEGDIPNDRATLYAIWKITVTFNADGGTIVETGGASTTRNIITGDIYGREGFPKAEKEGYKFLGWYNEDGERIYSATRVPGIPHTVTARWEKEV